MKVWFNGKIEEDNTPLIRLDDYSLLYGCGLFETLLIYNGQPILWDEHMIRMVNSAKKLKMEIPFPVDNLLQEALMLIKINKIDHGSIRITLSGSLNIFMTCKKGKPYNISLYNTGVSLCTMAGLVYSGNWLANHKTCSYMDKLLLKKQQGLKGYFDVIFANEKGNIAECCVSNIFCVKDCRVYTPPITAGILPGIMRDIVLKLSIPKTNIAEIDFTFDYLTGCQEVFLTNSLMGIMPVQRIENHAFKVPGEITTKLTKKYQEYYMRTKKHTL